MTQSQWYYHMIKICNDSTYMLHKCNWKSSDGWCEIRTIYLDFINKMDELTKVYELEKKEK